MVKIFLLVYQYVKVLQINLDYLKTISHIADEDIIIIDMGIDREVKTWLENQKEFDYICAEGLENYARILNTAIEEFSVTENVLILNANFICLGNGIEQLEEICNSEKEIGAVIPMNFNSICPQKVDLTKALDMIEERPAVSEKSLAIKMPCEYAFLARRFIEKIGKLDEELLLPDSIMLDYSFRGLCQKWKIILAEDVFVYEIVQQIDYYVTFLGGNADHNTLKVKWEMNYFNGMPNDNLIKAIARKRDEMFSVLEVGCDCGANLVRIKNLFPKAELFGLEINQSAAVIAANFAEVQAGNIEDCNLPFLGHSFDYILFGDVLEHLRDPEKVVTYCRLLLKPQGKIIASIPNLMHYTVLKSLIGGDFTYQDMGLLDRTHIHFFTFNEILRMFFRAGYRIDTCNYTTVGDMSEEDKRFVGELKNIGQCETYTYVAFQYLITASVGEKSEKEYFQPKFRSDEETIRLIVEEKKSLGRFGDGEFAIAFDISRQKFQRTDAKLRDRIRQVITQTDNSSLLIGIADNYGSLERYNAQAADAIKLYMTEETRKQHMSLLSPDRVYSDAYMTRPYVIYKDVFTNAPAKRFNSLKKIWDHKRIIIVEGAQTRLGIGNDLFDNAEMIKRILASATNAFDQYDDILLKCKECCFMADLFLLAIGPSSGVLAYDLSKQGIQAVDVGHIDMEYEWYLAGKGIRITVPNKYNNEILGGDDVCNTNLPKEYYEEIIADFSEEIKMC